MALKGERILDPYGDEIDFFVHAASERGGVVSRVSSGSGGYSGDPNNKAAYAVNPSGAKPIGLLYQDVVSYDTNRQSANVDKAGMQERVGMKAAISKKGRFLTNMIPSGVNPAGGEVAYLAANGLISNVQATGAPKVGVWNKSKDADGFAQVDIDTL